MIKQTLLSRKPTQWHVHHEGRSAIVGKSPEGVARCRRWYLLIPDAPTVRFPSRRAAFRFFEDGTKFSPKPVYAKHGRNTGARIR